MSDDNNMQNFDTDTGFDSDTVASFGATPRAVEPTQRFAASSVSYSGNWDFSSISEVEPSAPSIITGDNSDIKRGSFMSTSVDRARFIRSRQIQNGLGGDVDLELIYNSPDEFEAAWKEKEIAQAMALTGALAEQNRIDKTFCTRLDDKSALEISRINKNLIVYGNEQGESGLPWWKPAWVAKAQYALDVADKDLDLSRRSAAVMDAPLSDRAQLKKDLTLAEQDIGEMPDIDFPLKDALSTIPYTVSNLFAVARETIVGAAEGAAIGVVSAPLTGGAGVVAGASLGGTAGLAFGTAQALFNTYDIERGSAYRSLMKIRDADGRELPEDIQESAANIYGLLAAGLEYIPVSATTRLFGADKMAKNILKKNILDAVKDKTKRGVAKEIARDYSKSILAEGFTEGLQQITQSLAERTAKWLANEDGYNFEQRKIGEDMALALESSLIGMQGAALLGGVGAATRGAIETARVSRDNRIKSMGLGAEAKAEYDGAVLDSMQKSVDALSDSALESGERQKLFQKMAAKSSYRDIFVPAADLMQFIGSEYVVENRDKLQASGLLQVINDAIAESDESGVDARIRFEDYANKIMADKTAYKMLRRKIRTVYEGGASLDDVENNKAAMAKMYDEGRSLATQRQEDFTLAKQTILKRMTEGSMPPAQRNQAADYLANVALYLSQNTNLTMQEVLDRSAPSFATDLSARKNGNSSYNSIAQSKDIDSDYSLLFQSSPDNEMENDLKGYKIEIKNFFRENPSSWNFVKEIHKQENLSFRSIPVAQLRDLKIKNKIYKSKTYDRRQSSEYYVAEIDGKMSYVRVSNHWGVFNTVERAQDKDGNYDKQYVRHEWELIGGKKYPTGKYHGTSQAGYIEIPTVFDQTVGTFDIGNPNIYYQDNKNILGSYDDKTRLISLFNNSNTSTIIHEIGHYVLDMLYVYSSLPMASETLTRDFAAVREYLGIADGGAITREQHEKFADSLEKYFLTAEVPSEKVRGLFSAIKNWIASAFDEARRVIGIEISPEVTSVFDRILTARQEVDRGFNAREMRGLIGFAERLGLAGEALSRYRDKLEKYRNITVDNNYKALVIEENERLTEKFRAKKEEVEQSVRDAMADQRPMIRAYMSLYDMRVGDMDMPKLVIRSKDWDGDKNSARKRNGKSIFANDGAPFSEVSAMLGISEAQLRSLILNADIIAKSIDDEVAAEVHRQLGNPPEMWRAEERVQKSYANESRSSVLIEEIKIIWRALPDNSPISIEDRKSEYERMAADFVLDARVGDISPERYRSYASRNAESAELAINEGRLTDALHAKEKQARNWFIYLEMRKAKKDVDSSLRKMTQIGKQKTNREIKQEFLDAAKAILYRVYLSRDYTRTTAERGANLMQFIEEQNENGFDIQAPAFVAAMEDRRAIKELQYSDFRELSDSIKSIIWQGRQLAEFEKGERKISRENTLDELAQALAPLKNIERTMSQRKSLGMKAAAIGRSIDGVLSGLRAIGNRIDKGNANGIFAQTFVLPLTDASALENDLQARFSKRVFDIIRGLSKANRKRLSKYAEGSKEAMNGNEMIYSDLFCIALNMGSVENVRRMESGNGFSEASFDFVRRSLDKEMWDAVQAILDVLEDMYPILSKHHKEMSGLDMERAETNEITTPYGNYRGGYFPIVYDREMSAQMAVYKGLLDADYTRPTTSKGYTKSRLRNIHEPLKFNINIIASHLRQTIRDVAFRRPLREAYNILTDVRFVSMWDAKMGAEYRETITDILRNIANEVKRDNRVVEGFQRILRFVRQRLSLIGMGFRLTTIISQPLGFFSSASLLTEAKSKLRGKRDGYYWISMGLKEFFSPGNIEWALESSGALRNRLGTNDATIQRRLQEISRNMGADSFKERAEAFAYKGLQYSDLFVAISTWNGAYMQARDDFGNSHREAVNHADSIMERSQGGGGVAAIAPIMNQGEFVRIMTMFYSFFNALYQQGIQLSRDTASVRSVEEGIDVAARSVSMIVIPAILGAILSGDAPPDGDDDESVAGWLSWNILSYMMGAVPGLRETASAIEYRQSNTVLGRIGTYIGDFVKQMRRMANGERNATAATKSALNALALATGLPVGGQIADVFSWLTGVGMDENHPQSLQDLLWGIYKGKNLK